MTYSVSSSGSAAAWSAEVTSTDRVTRFPAGQRLHHRSGAGQRGHAPAWCRWPGPRAGPASRSTSATTPPSTTPAAAAPRTGAPTTPPIDPATTALVSSDTHGARPARSRRRSSVRYWPIGLSGGVQRVRRHAERRPEPARRPPPARESLSIGDRRQRRADRRGRHHSRPAVHAGARLRRRRRGAIGVAGASADATVRPDDGAVLSGWRAYDAALRRPPRLPLPLVPAAMLLAVGQRDQGRRGQDQPGRVRGLADRPVGPVGAGGDDASRAGPTARYSPGTATRRSPACSPTGTYPALGPWSCSCSTGPSRPTGASRAIRDSTARSHRTRSACPRSTRTPTRC